jgi:hypothetical protein
MHPNYQLSFARKAPAALPCGPILANRSNVPARAAGKRDDDLN